MHPITVAEVVPAVALFIPVILALAAVASPRHALGSTKAALAMALAFTAGAMLDHAAVRGRAASFGIQVDAPTCAMLLLVCTLGVVVVRYSGTYLQGDPRVTTYQRWLLLTLSAVTALVSASSLLVVVVAWTMTSLSLHRLLTFYPDRPEALVAAHKKFLVSRLADASLVVSLALVHANVGGFEIARIAAWVDSRRELPPSMELAAVLLVIAVALRSAQLPFHGWLTQVMEAPTPVSALLHAGVVNIGGFVLIRLAPWMARAELARMVLLAIGLVSAVTAALVMTTRVSVKVALAWSTCAQMGFMLVECALGLWSIALLHLVAHSLYKAHAFLRSGAAVEEWELQTSRARPAPPSLPRLGLAALFTFGCISLGLAVLDAFAPSAASEPSVCFPALLLGLSTLALLVAVPRDAGWKTALAAAARAVGVMLAYAALHALVAPSMPSGAVTSSRAAWVVAGLAFAALFVVKIVLHMRPAGTLAGVLHPWLFSGLYLDERFTRLTFRLWPPKMTASATPPRSLRIAQTFGVRA